MDNVAEGGNIRQLRNGFLYKIIALVGIDAGDP
jgi:hypothetical protein